MRRKKAGLLSRVRSKIMRGQRRRANSRMRKLFVCVAVLSMAISVKINFTIFAAIFRRRDGDRAFDRSHVVHSWTNIGARLLFLQVSPVRRPNHGVCIAKKKLILSGKKKTKRIPLCVIRRIAQGNANNMLYMC